MTNYIPTKEELEEMGFRNYFKSAQYPEDKRYQLELGKCTLRYIFSPKYQEWQVSFLYNTMTIPPTSKKDIETLIRLFSKPTHD